MGENGTVGDGKRSRKSNDAGGGKKRRRYLPHNKSVKKKGSYPLHPGVEGFFITCDGGREYQASSEALNILDSFFEELVHGGNSSIKQLSNKPLNKKITFEDSDSSDSDDDDDVEEENKVEQNAVEEENKVEQNAVEEENKVEQNAVEEENKVEQNAGEEENKVEENEGEKEDEEKGNKKQKLDVCSADNGNHDETGMGEKSDAHKIDEKNAHELPKADDNKGEIDEDNTIVKTTDKLPDMKADAPTCGLKDKVEEKSIDKLIEEELKELGDKTKRRFIKLDSGCNGVVFVQMRKKDGEKGPKDIAQHIVTSAAATRKHMSRFILRILPIEATCYASKEEISKAMQPLVERYFPSETENPQKFAVLYEARANTGIDKMEIIDAVAKSIPGPHKVDLSNPDKTIVVEIARTVCMLGVIDKYKELSKYNLRQLTSQKV